MLYERQLPASDTVTPCCQCTAATPWYSLSRSSFCARLQVVCVALHNSSAVLAHVIQSSERTLFLCNWEQPVEGERERSLTFLEAVLQARPTRAFETCSPASLKHMRRLRCSTTCA